MENVMTLREAIEEKKISLGTEEIKYVPDYNEVKFSGQSTGAEKRSILEQLNFHGNWLN